MTRVVDELVEHALRELADEERQRKLWLSSGGDGVSSFTECLSRLMDDSGLADALDKAEVIYEREIDQGLRDLDALLMKIDVTQPVKVLLADPRLMKAREMARALLEDLRRFGHDAATSS